MAGAVLIDALLAVGPGNFEPWTSGDATTHNLHCWLWNYKTICKRGTVECTLWNCILSIYSAVCSFFSGLENCNGYIQAPFWRLSSYLVFSWAIARSMLLILIPGKSKPQHPSQLLGVQERQSQKPRLQC